LGTYTPAGNSHVMLAETIRLLNERINNLELASLRAQEANESLEQENRSIKSRMKEGKGSDIFKSMAWVAKPDNYNGTRETFQHFINQLWLYTSNENLSDKDLIAIGLSFMKKGRAVLWAENYIENGLLLTHTHKDFLAALTESFGDLDRAQTARSKIKKLYQGSNTVEEYITNFEAYELPTKYDQAALINIFKKGLNGPLLKKMYATADLPDTLEEWKHVAWRIDKNWQEYRSLASAKKLGNNYFRGLKPTNQQNHSNTATNPKSTNPFTYRAPPRKDPNAMDIDGAKTWGPPRPVSEITCFKCHKKGHYANDCKEKNVLDIRFMSLDEIKEALNFPDFPNSSWITRILKQTWTYRYQKSMYH
jgi:hypothetical protein